MMNIYHIPSGPKNLSAIFPSINWGNVDNYYLEIKADSDIIATTNIFSIGCCCNENEYLRLHFCSYTGMYDAINFNNIKITHPVTDSTYEKNLPYNFLKTDSSLERFNINSTDIYEASTSCYTENDMNWIKELMDSSNVFIEWSGIENQDDSYIPIIMMTDPIFEIKKFQNDSASYKVIIKFKLSNQYINIRN